MICSCCLSSPTKHPSCGRTWRIDQPPSCQFDQGSTREKKWSVWKIRTDIHCISGWWLVGMIWKNKKCSKPPTRYYLYIYTIDRSQTSHSQIPKLTDLTKLMVSMWTLIWRRRNWDPCNLRQNTHYCSNPIWQWKISTYSQVSSAVPFKMRPGDVRTSAVDW